MADDTLPGPPAGRPTELQQLEAALAAGVITPELFDTLRAKLAPAEAPAAPPASSPAPAAPSEELPSLLAMFGSAPSPVAPPSPPAASPARPPATAADDAAARRRIEEHLAKLRQEEQAAKLRQAASVAPVAPPAPPSPAFYPEAKPTPTPGFYPASPPAPPTPAPVASPLARPTPPVADAAASAPRPAASASASSGRSWLPLLLVLLLAVVGGLAYYFTSTSHPDEELTSTQPAAPEPVLTAVPKPTKAKHVKAAKRAKTKQRAATTPVTTTEASDTGDLTAAASTAPTAASVPAAKATEPTAGQPVAAAPEASDDAATSKVREAMVSYYADLYAPPLHASQHFAPQVERLYIRQNLTPDAIEAELARSFFPDNQHAVCQIEPGTLRVSSPAADGSRTATFTEVMRLYRVSLQKYQRLRTQVRVRFNPAYQIVYMRQEKLLANTFEE